MTNISPAPNGLACALKRSLGMDRVAYAMRQKILKCIIEDTPPTGLSILSMHSQPSAETAISLSPRQFVPAGTRNDQSPGLISLESLQSQRSQQQMYETLSLKITGLCPLLMHNGSLADPNNSFSQAIRPIAAKRANKTDADYQEMAKLEFLGSLYLANGEPCIPGELFEAALLEGAKKRRKGPAAKAGIICDGMYPLEYDGPRTPLELWEDERFQLRTGVRIQRNRVMRTRPKFDQWSATIEVKFLPSLINRKEIVEIAELVGQTVGLGDWRPRFGRFEAAVSIAKRLPSRRAA